MPFFLCDKFKVYYDDHMEEKDKVFAVTTKSSTGAGNSSYKSDFIRNKLDGQGKKRKLDRKSKTAKKPENPASLIAAKRGVKEG